MTHNNNIKILRCVYGKPISGTDRRGPIVTGSEHQITGASAGFPPDLKRKLRPQSYFQKWSGVGLTVAPLFRESGAFFLRLARVSSGDYIVASRLLPRPEKGAGRQDRVYTHFVSLAVELSQYRPGLVLTLFDMLFDDTASGAGQPDLDVDLKRAERPILWTTPDLVDSNLARFRRLFSDIDDADIWKIQGSGGGGLDDNRKLSCNASPRLICNLRAMVGSFESFADEHDIEPWRIPLGFGLQPSVRPVGSGDLLRIEQRNEEVEIPALRLSATYPCRSSDVDSKHFVEGWYTLSSEARQTFEMGRKASASAEIAQGSLTQGAVAFR